jgi:hypothetical protein
MADPGPFDSAWMKWGWATVRAQTLQDEVLAFGQSDAAANGGPELRRKYDSRRHCIIWYCHQVPAFPPHWSLLLGDVISNYRACLDHIAWALVERGDLRKVVTDPDKLEKRLKNVYFPICRLDDTEFDKACRSKLPEITDADRRIVRNAQPYRQGKRKSKNSALGWLEDMSNVDKHRRLRPTESTSLGGDVVIGAAKDCEVVRPETQSKGNLIRDGSEVYRVYVRKTGPFPDLDVHFHFNLELALSRNVRLARWAAGVGKATGKLLSQFAEQPDEVLAIGLKTYESTGTFWLA